MLKIELLIATMDYQSGSLDSLLNTVPDNVNVIVVNQVTKLQSIPVPFNICANVTCHSFAEKGLSKSRNRALSLATGDIFVITDDDVTFLPDAFTLIEKAFVENPQQDILTFQMLKPEGTHRKRYKKTSFQHNKFSIGGVSSCEIAGRTQAIKSSQVHYDESFGLGAEYPIGEETIYLKDCLKAGLKIRSIPIAINSHPVESTGRIFSERTEFTRGAAFYRLYGPLAYMMGFIFYLKKLKLLSLTVGYQCAINAYLRGIYDYKKKVFYN